MVKILVLVESRRKVVAVEKEGGIQGLREAVLVEFDGILRPDADLIFQRWDEDFNEYVDLAEDDQLKEKDRVQVLQNVNGLFHASTPINVSNYELFPLFHFTRMHNRTQGQLLVNLFEQNYFETHLCLLQCRGDNPFSFFKTGYEMKSF